MASSTATGTPTPTPKGTDPSNTRKRRSFFASKLSTLPVVTPPAKPAFVPSSDVLAALAPPPGSTGRGGRNQPRREAKSLGTSPVDMKKPSSAEKSKGPISKVTNGDASDTPSTVASSRPRRAAAPVAPVKAKTSSPKKGKKRAPTKGYIAGASAKIKAVVAKIVNQRRKEARNRAISLDLDGSLSPPPSEGDTSTSTVPEETKSGPSKQKAAVAPTISKPTWWRSDLSANMADKPAPPAPKDYMTAGLYCQDANASSPNKLVNKVLHRRELEQKSKGKSKRGRPSKITKALPSDQATSFPPLPYDHGYKLFFEQEHEFVLPYNIQYEAESGALDGKKKPMAYSKIRGNVYPERSRKISEFTAVCKCDPESKCGENCINRIMNYLCGRDCPCGDDCTNKSLAKRKGANLKIVYTGSRGFGLMAMEDIREGDFVIDYRGEVVSINTFLDKCRGEYARSKNFYALAYDADEVIDAGVRGNEARFINHACDPNIEVRKYQTLGDGLEEFEVGMWALRDIKAGEELYYNYNFDTFSVAPSNDLRTKCYCGAPNCVGFLGRKPGEKSARVLAQELEAKARADAHKATTKAKKAAKNAMTKASVKKGRPEKHPVTVLKFQAVISARDVEKVKTKAARISNRRRKLPVPPKTPEQEKAYRILRNRERTTEEESTPAPAVVAPTQTAQRSRSFRLDKPEIIPITTSAPLDRRAKRSLGSASSSISSLTALPGSVPMTPSGSDDSNSSRSRNSGWADWLRKKAAEQPRTREQWEEFAIERRRGKVWLERMMADFGVAPYPGAPAESYTPSVELPPPGVPQKRGPPAGTPKRTTRRKSTSVVVPQYAPPSPEGGHHHWEAAYRRDQYPEQGSSSSSSSYPRWKHEQYQRQMDYISIGNGNGQGRASRQSLPSLRDLHSHAFSNQPLSNVLPPIYTPSTTSSGSTANDISQHHRVSLPHIPHTYNHQQSSSIPIGSMGSMPPPPPHQYSTPSQSQNPTQTQVKDKPRSSTAKKSAIAKRNGAPMGWVFVTEDQKPREGGDVVEDVGPRSARRTRASLNKV